MFTDTCNPHDDNQLAGELLKLARIKTRDIIAKGKLRSADYDDFVSDLVTSLFKRVRKWDASKMPLQSYLECTVRLDVRALARLSRYRKRPEVSLEVLLQDDDNEFVSQGAELENEAFHDQFNNLITRVDIESFLKTLSERERLFFRNYKSEGLRDAAARAHIRWRHAERIVGELESYLCEKNVGYLNFFGRNW